MPDVFAPASDALVTIPFASAADDARTAWESHLDAGRLTAARGPRTKPHIAANRARTEAIFLARAAFHRSQGVR